MRWGFSRTSSGTAKVLIRTSVDLPSWVSVALRMVVQAPRLTLDTFEMLLPSFCHASGDFQSVSIRTHKPTHELRHECDSNRCRWDFKHVWMCNCCGCDWAGEDSCASLIG